MPKELQKEHLELLLEIVGSPNVAVTFAKARIAAETLDILSDQHDDRINRLVAAAAELKS